MEMLVKIDQRLAHLGIELPVPASPAGAYVPFVQVGALLIVSGQLPMRDGRIEHPGRVGAEITLDEGVAAARLCGLNLLAQARAACEGDLDRVRRVVRLGGFVAAGPGFIDHPKVLNGASELMVEVLGEAGRHARFAVGAASLPLGAAVEVEGIFEIA
jgi:enamine deaminase RidA (YjgF/YER057c/UK114 family)